MKGCNIVTRQPGSRPETVIQEMRLVVDGDSPVKRQIGDVLVFSILDRFSGTTARKWRCVIQSQTTSPKFAK
jgi:hypothetical protein